jgi:isopentenyl diphosphate isomerase/L-lactate dehydrogenase-like FMN-dependent dehydrogenase
MYINKNRDITMTLIKMAEVYGFHGVVIAVDTQVIGKRISDTKNNFSSSEWTRFEVLEEIHKRMTVKSPLRNLNRKEFVDNRDLSLD